MSRHFFGYGAADYAITLAGVTPRVVAGAVGTVWTAKSGGGHLTDLLASDGVTAASTVVSESDGRVGFYGPDGVTSCWLDFGQGRFVMQADDRPTYGDGATAAVVVERPKLVDVRDHGWAGTGGDETAALTASRDAAGAAGVVYVPAGTGLTDPLTLSLAGQRWQMNGVEIRAKDSTSPAVVVDVTANGVRVEGLTVNGRRSTQGTTGLDGTKGIGLRIKGVTGARVEGVTVVDCPGEGILVDASSDVRVARSAVTNCCQSGNRKSVLVYAITGACADVTFDHVVVDSTTPGGGGIGAAAKAYGISGFRVEHCKARFGGGTDASPGADTLGYEAWTQDPALYAITDVHIVESYAECSAGSNQAFGVSLGGVVRGVQAGNIVRNCQKVSFENIGQSLTCLDNTAEASGYLSVAAAWSGQVTKQVAVVGNTVSGTTSWALEINGGPSSVDGCVIEGNTIRGTYMSWSGTTTGVVIAKNYFKGTVGGLLQQSGSAHSGWKVDGNTIDVTGVTGADGFIIAGGSDGDIDNNKIKGGRHCIYGWTAADDIRVRGNTLRGAAVDGIRTEATMTNWTIAGANDIRGCTGYGIRLIGPPTGFSVGNNRVSGNTAGQTNLNGATLVPLV